MTTIYKNNEFEFSSSRFQSHKVIVKSILKEPGMTIGYMSAHVDEESVLHLLYKVSDDGYDKNTLIDILFDCLYTLEPIEENPLHYHDTVTDAHALFKSISWYRQYYKDWLLNAHPLCRLIHRFTGKIKVPTLYDIQNQQPIAWERIQPVLMGHLSGEKLVELYKRLGFQLVQLSVGAKQELACHFKREKVDYIPFTILEQ